MNFSGKHVLITGASSGIGEALARAFAAQGAHLVLGARRVERLDQLASELRNQHGVQVVTRACDVTRKADCQALVQSGREQLGPLDVLVLNAGISMNSPLQEAQPEVLEQVMQVNFFGAQWVLQAGLADVVARQGAVVGVSSVAGYVGLPGRSGYSASKAALNALLSCLRAELYGSGVRVLTVAPGFTQSEIRQHALNSRGESQGESTMNETGMMSAEEVARQTLHALQANKRELILTALGKRSVRLSRLFPAFLEKTVAKRAKNILHDKSNS